MRFKSKHVTIYPWHSINVVPQWNCIAIVENEPPYERAGSVFELVLFGTIIHIHVPLNLPSMGSRLVGPVWSKRRKVWH